VPDRKPEPSPSTEPTASPEPPQLAPGSAPELPPGYVWAYQPPVEPERPWKAPRWLRILTIIWAVGLLVSGAIYALRGKPTVREQTTAPSAQTTVDRAIGNVIAAAGPGPVVTVGPYLKTEDCKITPVRPGVEYVRVVDFYATPGTESALLHTIATGLPASYSAKSGPGNVLDLSADAGDYVGVVGAAPAPGEIEIKAETGCREGGTVARGPAAPNLNTAEMAPIASVLTTVGLAAASTSAAEVPCAGSAGGVVRTVSAHVAPVTPQLALGTVLAKLAPTPVTSSQNVFAYRAGNRDIVTTQDSSGITISSTARCP
jgi:hypothetical protein